MPATAATHLRSWRKEREEVTLTARMSRLNGLADRFGRWYIDKLLDAVGRDEQVRLAFNEVNQLVKPATSLFAPSIMARVLLRR